jgi:hypothetical protein
MVGKYLQDCHPEREPEVLLSDDPYAIWVPRVGIEVVTISENDKHPSYTKQRS